MNTRALALVFLVCGGDSAAFAAESKVSFVRQIRPILSEHCFRCHGPDEHDRQAELRLDQSESALSKLPSGVTAVVSGDAHASALFQRIHADDPSKVMPPAEFNRPLSDEQKALLATWIEQGAEFSQHWSFESPKRPTVPQSKTDWARNPIDRFVLSRLEAEGLSPKEEASRETLIRRLTLDLIGLPPTTGEIDAFLKDRESGAYERLVDRLLKSPRFGERLAIDWLDAARFADTNGYHIDNGRDMTKWREYVIDSFNENVPFDRFTIEQLAGDILAKSASGASAERLQIASGFNRNHMINFEGGAIPEEYQVAYIVDRVNTTSTVWLGLTMACAQCHDHKYDPMTQRDFYRMYAFFNNVPEKGLDGYKGNSSPMIRFPAPDVESEIERLKAEIAKLDQKLIDTKSEIETAQKAWEDSDAAKEEAKKLEPASVVALALAKTREDRTDSDRDAIKRFYEERVSPIVATVRNDQNKLRKEIERTERRIPSSMVMEELDRPRETFMLTRGQYDRPGEKVTAGAPTFLPPVRSRTANGEANLDRLDLANWLVSGEHPLVARVYVNRLWQMFFGVGIVKSAEDFGSQGETPTHPELLDWLASEFVTPEAPSNGAWNVKHMIRTMVTSATYRQAASAPSDSWKRDPENRLLSRGPRFRLQAEFIRDQALAVSGLLNPKIGGRSVNPYQPPGIWEELASREDGANWTAQAYEQDHGEDLYRRTMYTFWKRTAPPPSLMAFDTPDRETCAVRRARTNTPIQALVTMNDPTYVEAARKFAERIVREGGNDDPSRIAFAMNTVVSHLPTTKERASLEKTLERARKTFQHDPQKATQILSVGESPRDESLHPIEVASWAIVATTILNSDEALTRP